MTTTSDILTTQQISQLYTAYAAASSEDQLEQRVWRDAL